jgi:hypothetical protein
VRGSRTVPISNAKIRVKILVGLGGHNTNRFSVVAGEVIALGSSRIQGAPDGSTSERPAGLVGLTR